MNVIKNYFLQIFVAYIMVCVGFIHAAEGQSLLQSRMPLAISLQEYCPSPISIRTRTQHYDFQSSSHVDSGSSSGSTSSTSVACAQIVSSSPKLSNVYCKFCIDVHAYASRAYALDAAVAQELEVLFGIAKSQPSGNGKKEQPFIYQFEQSQSVEYAAAIVAGELLEKRTGQITVEEIQKIIDRSGGKDLSIIAQEVCSYILFCFFMEPMWKTELISLEMLDQKISFCLMREYLGYFKDAVEVEGLMGQMSSLGSMIGAEGETFSYYVKNKNHTLAQRRDNTFMAFTFDRLRKVLQCPEQIADILNRKQIEWLLKNLSDNYDSLKSIQSLPSQRLHDRVVGPRSFSGQNSANGSLTSNGSYSPLALSPRGGFAIPLSDESVGGSSQTDYRQLVLPGPLLGSGAPAILTNGAEEAALLEKSCWLKRCFKKHPKVTACLATLITAGVGCGTYCIYAYTSWFHR